MKIVHNENGSITATVSIPKELEEAIEEETHSYSDVDLLVIFYTDAFGHQSLIATTNNLDKWLVDHNSWRVADGNEPESLDDFEIEEADAYIYEEVK